MSVAAETVKAMITALALRVGWIPTRRSFEQLLADIETLEREVADLRAQLDELQDVDSSGKTD